MITTLLQKKIDELYDKKKEKNQMKFEQTFQKEKKIKSEQNTQENEQIDSN